MRARLVFAMVLAAAAGCGRDEALGPDAPVIPPTIDAPPTADAPFLVDAGPRLCMSPTGTADVTAMGSSGSDITYQRLYAGAVDEVGPIAPVGSVLAGGAPMTITVLFTNVSPFDADLWPSCEALDTNGCDTVGLIARLPSLAPGTEVGTHDVTFTKTDNPSFTLDGTVTIDTFVDPFTSTPGQIAGSVAGSMAGRTVTGTFDNEFCTHLLTATI